MAAFYYALALYFLGSFAGSLFFYWALSPELLAAIDFLPVRVLLPIFLGFVAGHAILLAYVFCTSKSFDVIISRSWLVFLSLVSLIVTSKMFCFGGPPIIEGSPAHGISLQWTRAACDMEAPVVTILIVFTVATLIVIWLKYLSDDYNKREGSRILREIIRMRR
jgi:hypothetical protein